MNDKKIIIGHVLSNVTYNLNGNNIDHIIKSDMGTVLVTKDGARVKLSMDRKVVNEGDFDVREE